MAIFKPDHQRPTVPLFNVHYRPGPRSLSVLRYNTLDSDVNNLYYLFMKTQTQYITDGKGKKKAVILDIKEYERLIHALEELEDKKAFVSVVHEKSIPYGEIESRLKKSKRI